MQNADSSNDNAKKLGTSNSSLEQANTINISQEALEVLARSITSDTIDTFLSKNGKNLYDAAIRSLKTYPEDLAAKLDDNSLSEEKRTEIANALTAREMNAFTKYSRQSPPDLKMYYEELVAPMFNRDSGPRFKKEADQALERFDAVQSVIEAARTGNEIAFKQLQTLAESESSIDDFMSYAEKLSQSA